MVQETQVPEVAGGPQASQYIKQSQQPTDRQKRSEPTIKWLVQQEQNIGKVHPAQLLQRGSGPCDRLPFPWRGNGNAIIQLRTARIQLRGLGLFVITWAGLTWRCNRWHHHRHHHPTWCSCGWALGLLALIAAHDATEETISRDATWHLKCWNHLKLFEVVQIEQSNGN